MNVGLRELKAKLSAFLHRAAGEVIRVTNRGRPVAILGPPPGTVNVAAAIEAGWVTPPTSNGLGPVRRYRATAPALDTLGDDRRE